MLGRKMRKNTSLANMAKGQRGLIISHLAQGAVRQRLLDLGLIPSCEIEVVRYAPLGDPLEILIGTNHVVLRRSEAKTVLVQPEN